MLGVRRTRWRLVAILATITLVLFLTLTSRGRGLISRQFWPNAEFTGVKYEELPPLAVDEASWPWWRGVHQDGKSPAKDLPITWSPSENVVWKTAVPGAGWSSPVVANGKVFLTTGPMQRPPPAPPSGPPSPDDRKPDDADYLTQSILCYSQADGKELWSHVAHRGPFMQKHEKNSQASATVACDGERVFAAFLNRGRLWVTAVDLDGKRLWQTSAGNFVSEHGYGSSPVIYGSFVIVAGDNQGSGFIAALHRKTGVVVWRTHRHSAGSYGTPVVARLAGRDQLLLGGADDTTSYDPKTGERIWFCRGPSHTTGCTVAFGNDHVVASGGYPEREILCVRADGTGDVTHSHIAWRSKKGVSYVPSPLIDGDRAFIIEDQGIATCFELTTGKTIKTKRVKGPFTGSPVLAAGRLYMTNEDGSTLVLSSDGEFNQIAKNDLDEEAYTTPAIADGKIYLRTHQHLYCIGPPAQTTESGTGRIKQ